MPVLVGDDWRAVMLWRALYDAGVYVNVAIYPAVQRGGALLRTSVMATHEREHLDRRSRPSRACATTCPSRPTGAPPMRAGGRRQVAASGGEPRRRAGGSLVRLAGSAWQRYGSGRS